MVYAQPNIYPGELNIQTLQGFWHPDGSHNLDQTTRHYNNQQDEKKKRTCEIVDFAVLADHWVKLIESEKKEKYLDLAQELKKLWNMKVTILLIVSGALARVTKGIVKGLEDLEIRGQVETIQTTVLLRWDESWRLEETLIQAVRI